MNGKARPVYSPDQVAEMKTLLKQNKYENMGAIAKSLYKRFNRTRAGVLTKLHALRSEALKAGNVKNAATKKGAAPAKKAATKSASAIQMQTIKIPVSKVSVVEEAGQVFLELKF